MIWINKYTIGALIAALVVLSIWGYGRVQYNKGYSARALQAELELKDLRIDLLEEKDKAVNRQIAANKRAQENSTKQILQIQVEKDQLEKLLEDQENEARKDPNSKRIGLDAPAVLRINKIR